jgi:hypothetical protein
MMNEVMEKQIGILGLPVTPMEEIGAFRVQRPGDPVLVLRGAQPDDLPAGGRRGDGLEPRPGDP